ncbi:MAG: hypothetical protein LBT97_06770 [Planctomycetota bacterium]|jgi:hypothetical protein|nr:hypothetical protein [Planctomycetota bacterium]
MARAGDMIDGERAPVHSRKDGFDVYNRAGGKDYWPVLEAFLRGRVETENLKHNRSKRKVYAFEYGGARYVLKRDLMRSAGLRRLFPGGGWTFHTRAMRKVNRAVDRGCRATPDIFLVAERWTGLLRQEVFALMEFVDGEMLLLGGEIAKYRSAIGEVMAELHAHGVTLSDVNARNYLVGPRGLKVIDLACRFPDALEMARDAVKVKIKFAVDLPPRGIVDASLRAAIALFYKIRGKA